MFKKILVANRGEIALRIVRACKEMGIAAVTIHSEVDRFALHVKRASHSHCLSKKPLDAYLNGRRIIECAKLTVWAFDWPSVLRRARRALEEMRMFGVKTTIPYYLEMIKSEEFQKGVFNTGLVEAHPEWLKYSNKSLPQHKAAVIAAAIALNKT
ncbi:TPA: biotin carboxylase N-terminal domain-containing protein [Legionella pneumophila]|uniref:Putative Biotin carboxylase n=1 Tax=Legionella pneumophila TaxID=446 RepID=A0A378K9F7_LEGPN|nr:biotin carboxylase N-terminal domain-containing protein [Legionella pneumophila]ANH14013.1 hypothetical protein A5478_13595 [Legionella pneumophila]ANH16974.1 hypothetical protein A5480_13590 [Legionella pneumophila]ANH19951.1 hypothetical protein A5479_13630 [Legionella pneumophila]APX20834.1 hypothetical protein A1D14_13610 [Legionella pneumophila]AQL13011.1 hypothetical protein A1D13_13610 [Legionella pneumophila]